MNYIRNSVKVVVDAYHGTTTFYLANAEDPLIRTLQAVFPDLLKPLDEMPADLRRHVRYPEGIFNLQAAVYSTYHMTSPAIFYNREDLWSVATEVSSDQPGARRYIRIDRTASPARVTRSYTFPGGCITERFVSGESPERLASQASSIFGFVTRDQLARDLDRRSAGRLQLDPP